MVDVVLFHHVQGLTDGVAAFADALRSGGHTVHTPDLFDGERPGSIEAGLAFVAAVGDDVVDARADAVVAELAADVVYAGFSFGAATAQRLAQTRPGAGGALLYESFVSLSAPWAFGPWPEGLPAQVHGMERDPFFALEGDLDGARELVEAVGEQTVEVFLYPGDRHLFLDSSLPSYEPEATELVLERSRDFLGRVG